MVGRFDCRSLHLLRRSHPTVGHVIRSSEDRYLHSGAGRAELARPGPANPHLSSTPTETLLPDRRLSTHEVEPL